MPISIFAFRAIKFGDNFTHLNGIHIMACGKDMINPGIMEILVAEICVLSVLRMKKIRHKQVIAN